MEPGKRLPSKVAIITGGASGIGEATARVFATHGASVVLCDLQDELGMQVAGEIVAAGGTAEYRHLDVTREDEWTALVAAVEGKYGRVDALCNVAGIGSAVDTASGKRARMELPSLSLDSWNQVMAVNSTGVFLGTKAVHAAMNRAGGGSIINISTMYAIVAPSPQLYEGTKFLNPPGYSASKAALLSFTRYVASFWGGYGIRSNAILPGPFSNTEDAGSNTVSQDDAFLNRLRSRTCLSRIGHPAELAGALLFLASDASSYVTGQGIVVDGGWTVT